MKKFICLVGLLVGLVSVDFVRARVSSTRNYSTREAPLRNAPSTRFVSVTKYKAPTQNECNIDINYCFDRYCYDKKSIEQGQYSKCGSVPVSTITLNVEECLEVRSVIKKLDLLGGCKSYAYNYVVGLLTGKEQMNAALRQNSEECAVITEALEAAKKCYSVMISHDGSVDPSLRLKLDALCGENRGGNAEMVDRFLRAGDYGDSNIGAVRDMELTGQNTVKRENWRQVVDAVLAGYMEIAELSCGAEDYKIAQINEYIPDSRENLAMVKAKAQATQMGKETANRIVNSWFRATDCMNSPLPTGGERWEYIKDGAPDCRLVCLDGYQRGANSSECVKIQMKNDISYNYIGLNWDANKKEDVKREVIVIRNTPAEEETEQVVIASVNMSGAGAGGTAGGGRTFASCSQLKGSKGRTTWSYRSDVAACEVFFPYCRSNNMTGRRAYERVSSQGGEYDEYFCTGERKGVYDKWYHMTLLELNDIFGTVFKQAGNSYAESGKMMNYLDTKCRTVCKVANTTVSSSGGGNSNSGSSAIKRIEDELEFARGSLPSVKNSSTQDFSVSVVEYTPQEYAELCSELSELPNSVGGDSGNASEWAEYLSGKYKNEKGSCQTEFGAVDTLVSKRGYEDYGWGSEDNQILNNFKNCICPNSNVANNDAAYNAYVEESCNIWSRDPVECEKAFGFYCPRDKITSPTELDTCSGILLFQYDACTSNEYLDDEFNSKCLWSKNFTKDSVFVADTAGSGEHFDVGYQYDFDGKLDQVVINGYRIRQEWRLDVSPWKP